MSGEMPYMRVKTLAGAEFRVDVLLEEPIRELEARIAKLRQLPADGIKLAYKGKLPADSVRLHELEDIARADSFFVLLVSQAGKAAQPAPPPPTANPNKNAQEILRMIQALKFGADLQTAIRCLTSICQKINDKKQQEPYMKLVRAALCTWLNQRSRSESGKTPLLAELLTLFPGCMPDECCQQIACAGIDWLECIRCSREDALMKWPAGVSDVVRMVVISWMKPVERLNLAHKMEPTRSSFVPCAARSTSRPSLPPILHLHQV